MRFQYLHQTNNNIYHQPKITPVVSHFQKRYGKTIDDIKEDLKKIIEGYNNANGFRNIENYVDVKSNKV